MNLKKLFNIADAELPKWRGIDGTILRWHGEWADPEVEYRGKLFSKTELEDFLWEEYKDYCYSEGIEPTDEGFEDVIDSEDALEAINTFYDLGYWVEDLEEDDEDEEEEVESFEEEDEEISDSVDEEEEEEEFENWEDYRFTFTIYGNDGEIIDQFDGTDIYPELSDTLYDDDSATELAKEALRNYVESYYDGEGDKIKISVDAHEYDMGADDYNGKVREVYSEEYDLR